MTNEAAADADELRRRIDRLPPDRRRLFERRLTELSRADRRPLPRLPRSPGLNRFPSTAGQERLYYQQQLRPGSTAYVLPVALRLTGAVREESLREALSALLRRHEPLRTGFEVVPGEGLVQVVHDAETVTLPFRAEPVAPDDVPGVLAAFAAEPFDLADPPLLRAALWHSGTGAAETWTLALSVHHIVVDGWSLSILLDELGTALTDLAGRRVPAFAALPVQFADFAAWQRGREDDDGVARRLAHWRGVLAGAVAPALPVTADPRPEPGGPVSVPVTVSPAVSAAVSRVALAAEATPFMALVSAWSVVLWRWSGQDDLTLLTATAGRPRPELERLVGFFAGTVPLRMRLGAADTFHDLLARAREVCLAAYANEDVPLHRVLTGTGDEPTGRAMRLPVMVALRDVPTALPRLPGTTAEIIDVPPGEPDFELSLELAPRPDGRLSGRLGYAPALFAPATAERLVTDLLDILGLLVARPATPLADLLPAPAAPAAGAVVRGHRVDPAEVASLLRADAEVGDAIVLAQADEDGSDRLLGYVTGVDPAGPPDPDALRERLVRNLPAPLVPDHLTPLGALPRTTSGRLDRAALPVPEPARVRPAGRYEPPRGAVEQVLAEVWAEILEIEAPGRDDDFFRLGGHSLLATLMVSQIRELFRVELPLHFFVDAPTLAALGALLRERTAERGFDADRIAEIVLRVRAMSAQAVEEELRG